MRRAYLYPFLSDNLKCAFGVFQGKRAFTGPHTVMIDIEDNCDLNCIMCYFHSPLLEKTGEFQSLDYDTYKDILKDLKSMGTRKISICGKGEPFLHPEISDIIDFTKQLRFYLNIFTNGIHIPKNFLSEIFRLDQITFSLHAGDRETYYKVHPQAGEGCFEDVRYALRQIREYKHRNKRITPWVKIINVIFNLNYRKIDEMFALAEEFGADEILFKPAQLTLKQDVLKMDCNQIDYLTQALRKRQNSKIRNNIGSYLATIMPYASINKVRMDKPLRKVCYVPWYQSTVLSNGDVVACPYNQVVLGNINKDNFRTIWFSPEYNNFRKTLDCGDCAANAVYPYLRKFKGLFRWRGIR